MTDLGRATSHAPARQCLATAPQRAALVADRHDRHWRVDAALDWVRAGGSLLFLSSTRLGRSMLLDAIATSSGASRVLRCMPTRAHGAVPYRALADLLSTVTDAELDVIPRAQRGVLTGALRRGGTPAGPAAAPRRVCTLVRTLLDSLAQAGPLLLVIHDLQRLDPATAGVLRFAGERKSGEPVQLIASEWVPGDRDPVGYQLCPTQLLAMPLDSFTAVDVLERTAFDYLHLRPRAR
jgi:hypothetical protein